MNVMTQLECCIGDNMACFKCGSINQGIRYYTMKELKKGSPSRGKNKEYVEVKVKHTFCKDCQSATMEYS